MNKFNTIAIFIAILAIVISGIALMKKVEVIQVPVAATVGPDHYEVEYFYGGLVTGGATTTYASTTSVNNITGKDLCDYSAIYISPTIGGYGTTTLPLATSTTATKCFAKDGATKKVIFYNASTTAGAKFILATSTGSNIFGTASGTAMAVDKETAVAIGEYVECLIRRRLATAVDYFCNKFLLR